MIYAAAISLLLSASLIDASGILGRTAKNGGNVHIVVADNGAELANRIRSLDARTPGFGEVRHEFSNVFSGFSAVLSDHARSMLEREGAKILPNLPKRITQDATFEEIDYPWGLDRIDQADLPLDGIYSYEYDGQGVNAYVVDTGLHTAHADFGGRAVLGFDYYNDGVEDGHGHGTHCAGTIGGTEFGVSKSVNLIGVKVLDAEGSGSSESVVAGLDWVAGQLSDGVPSVISMSLGGPGYDEAEELAINAVVAAGGIVSVAAGNDDSDACSFSPAMFPNAITAGATDINDRRADFSNWGECVDIFAPGVDVLSADAFSMDGSVLMSGTSMACPHVSGVIAQILQGNPSATQEDVRNHLYCLGVSDRISGLSLSRPDSINHLLQQNVVDNLSCEYSCDACVHGTCNDLGNCICEAGWTGDDCNVEQTCEDNCNGQVCDMEVEECICPWMINNCAEPIPANPIGYCSTTPVDLSTTENVDNYDLEGGDALFYFVAGSNEYPDVVISMCSEQNSPYIFAGVYWGHPAEGGYLVDYTFGNCEYDDGGKIVLESGWVWPGETWYVWMSDTSGMYPDGLVRVYDYTCPGDYGDVCDSEADCMSYDCRCPNKASRHLVFGGSDDCYCD